MRPDQIDFYMSLADEDASGTLDFIEFMNMILISKCDFEDVYKVCKVFETYDKGKSNNLDKGELKKCLDDLDMNNFPDNKFDSFFDILDVDNSGLLNKTEFYMMVEALRNNMMEYMS